MSNPERWRGQPEKRGGRFRANPSSPSFGQHGIFIHLAARLRRKPVRLLFLGLAVVNLGAGLLANSRPYVLGYLGERPTLRRQRLVHT
jgi:hypothetical protein